MSLKGKAALVTGSTSGIGHGIASALAAEGADIMLNGFGDAAQIEALRAGMAAQYGVRVAYSGADISSPEQIAAMVADTEAKLGSLDILVNNAGIQFVANVEDFPDRALGRDHRHQPLGRVPWHEGGDPRDEAARLGSDHQHRLGAWPGRQSAEGGLRRGQARRGRHDQGGGDRAGQSRRDGERDLPRLGADAAGAETARGQGEAGRHLGRDSRSIAS